MQLQYTTKDIERFWSKVDRNGPIPLNCPELGPCWIWTAGKGRRNYGKFSIQGKTVAAHRVAYEITNGPLPEGKLACHHCDNPPCCNPSHLWPGTTLDNSLDMLAKGRGPTGDRAGNRRYPEHYPKGADHWTHKRPENMARGDEHWTHRKPEHLARGENHYGHLHPEIYRGENNGNARLTADDVREIRSQYANGVATVSQLARLVNVTWTQAKRIILRESWKDI